MRPVPAALAAVLALALAWPAGAAATLRIEGHGWGHGVGLSQWGARGYAQLDGWSFRAILGHYYPGTSVRPAGHGGGRVRVLLKRGRTVTVCSAERARDARGRSVALRSGRAYRVAPWRAAGLALTDTRTRKARAHLTAPVRVTGGSSACLRGTALNGLADRSYRGVLSLQRDGRRVVVVDDVAMRHYLYGVVPSEMPASWPAAALQAQAVAARTYALRSLKPGTPFDVLPNQSSQVYGGIEAETPATTAAVRRTDPLVVMSGAAVAATYFSSSSGGRTAAVEEGFPGAEPLSYLVSLADPHDALSPDHDWTVTLSDRQARRKLGDAVFGKLRQVVVATRTPSGRAAAVALVGSEGTNVVTAGLVQARLGLKSVWFAVKVQPVRRRTERGARPRGLLRPRARAAARRA